jgi:hypothetical protein
MAESYILRKGGGSLKITEYEYGVTFQRYLQLPNTTFLAGNNGFIYGFFGNKITKYYTNLTEISNLTTTATGNFGLGVHGDEKVAFHEGNMFVGNAATLYKISETSLTEQGNVATAGPSSIIGAVRQYQNNIYVAYKQGTGSSQRTNIAVINHQTLSNVADYIMHNLGNNNQGNHQFHFYENKIIMTSQRRIVIRNISTGAVIFDNGSTSTSQHHSYVYENVLHYWDSTNTTNLQRYNLQTDTVLTNIIYPANNFRFIPATSRLSKLIEDKWFDIGSNGTQSKDDEGFRILGMPHLVDYNLFYGDVRTNIGREDINHLPAFTNNTIYFAVPSDNNLRVFVYSYVKPVTEKKGEKYYYIKKE